MSHTLGLTHKLVVDGGCSAPSPGQANCQLSHSTPGIDFHSILHASGGGGAALQPEPIVHSWTTPGVAMAPRIRRTRISNYLPWSQAWVLYFEATVRYHPRLLPHVCSETFCGATPGGPWSVTFGRVRARVPGTRHPYAAPHPTVGALPPFSRLRRSGPGGLPGTYRGLFSSARRSGSSIAAPSAPRRGPTAPCAWFWICPRLEEPRLIRAFLEMSCGTVYLPWMRPRLPPLPCAARGLAAPALHMGRAGIRRPPAPWWGPLFPLPFYSVRGGASLDCRTRSRVQPRPPLPRGLFSGAGHPCCVRPRPASFPGPLPRPRCPPRVGEAGPADTLPPVPGRHP